MANDLIDYKNLFGDIQQKVVDILKEDAWFSERGIAILSENLLDIDFQIKNALCKQGCVIVVMTMQATYAGHDGMVEEWQVDNLEVDCVENPIVHRGNLKKLGFEDGTTTDILYRIAERLGGPQGGHFGMFCPKSCEVGEDSSLVVGKAKFTCACRNDVKGIVDPETKVEIPFVTKVEIADLISEIYSLKSVVEGFSTEEIKSDITNLKEADIAIGERIDGLDDVYQPKGDYALKGDLNQYALKSQIPVNTSQLNNDAGYMTDVYWGEIKDKPAVALETDIPTKVSQLENDSNYLTTVNWADIQGKPYIPENIPTKTSQLINDAGFITQVTWNDVQDKPNLIDEEKLSEATRNFTTFAQVDSAIDEKIADIPKSEDAKRLWNDSRTQYISGSREIFEVQTIPAHYTEWTFSDGIQHSLRVVEKSDHTWCIQTIDTNNESINKFATQDEAVEFLSTTLEIEFDTDALTATRQYIEEQQTLVKIADLATTNQIPTKTSQLENDSGYLTNHQSLENYATIEYVDKEISKETNVLDAAVEALNSKISEKANASDIPTKTSQLANDSGYLTEHQSLAGYATTEYVDGKIQAESTVRQESIENVKQMIPTKTSDLTNDSGYLTEHQSLDGFATIKYVDGKIDVESTTRQESIENVKQLIPTKTSDLTNDSGYLTEHQSLDNYATKTYVDERIPTEFPWNKISGKPDLVQKDQFDSANKHIQDQIDQINADIEGQVEVTKVYGQYKARYIDGDGNVFEKQDDGSYAQTGTLAKISDLRTKTSQLINDSGFITGVTWDEISQKPTIPTKVSELQNDEGYLKEIYWEQIQNKPDIATDTQFEEFKNEVDSQLERKLDISAYDKTAISNSSKKIDANRNVYNRQYTPSHYTPWTYSDGNSYADPLIYGDDATGWRLAIDQDTYRSQTYQTQQQAQNVLDTALEIVYTRENPVVQITATRDFVAAVDTWTKIDELALKSDIVTSSGISEQQCREIVEGYQYQTATQVDQTISAKGYQTAEQVNTAINSKGYVTESQVESQIASKGYQTQTQVQAIAAATLPAGYAETLVVGTLTDGSEVQFNILTKAIS